MVIVTDVTFGLQLLSVILFVWNVRRIWGIPNTWWIRYEPKCWWSWSLNRWVQGWGVRDFIILVSVEVYQCRQSCVLLLSLREEKDFQAVGDWMEENRQRKHCAVVPVISTHTETGPSLWPDVIPTKVGFCDSHHKLGRPRLKPSYLLKLVLFGVPLQWNTNFSFHPRLWKD